MAALPCTPGALAQNAPEGNCSYLELSNYLSSDLNQICLIGQKDWGKPPETIRDKRGHGPLQVAIVHLSGLPPSFDFGMTLGTK